MFCKKCGAEIPDDSKHCPECGVAVENGSKKKKASKIRNLSKKKKIGLIVIVIVIILFAIILSSGGGNDDDYDSTVSEYGNYLTVSNEIKNSMTENEFKEKCTVLDYGLLNKNAEKYKGQYVKYSGEIFQIQEYDEIGMILLETDDSYNDLIYVIYTGSNDFVEDDYVTVYGVIEGYKDYETKGGTINSVPLMDGIYIE